MENKPLWTITRVLEWTKQYFANKGIENPRLDAEILLCAVLKCERITLYVHFDQPLDDTELAEYRSYVTRRANQEPLAYILGTKAFMKHSFKVTPAVLVPRPETELLVESVAKAAVGAGKFTRHWYRQRCYYSIIVGSFAAVKRYGCRYFSCCIGCCWRKCRKYRCR